MVRRLGLLLSCFICAAVYAEVLVDVEVHGERAAAYSPIEAFVRVKRPEGQAIDPTSFHLQGKPLAVEFLHDNIHSSVTVINGHRREERSVSSLYRFQLEGVAPGEYVLPPVVLSVGGRRYQSETTAYFIHGSSASESFRLHRFVQGAQPLYPGQKVVVGYRLAFQQPVEQVVQTLPLLEAEGFRKIDEPQIDHETQGEITVQEITQTVQALSPGVYHFPASVVEGLPYRRDFFGRRIFEKTRLRAEADPITLEVAPFPDQGRPEEFTGALGRFHIEAELISQDQVAVGDRLKLCVKVKGEGVWSTADPPDLSLSHRFARDFRLSDLPPEVVMHRDEKQFLIELRPLTAVVDEIPPIRYASFDPDKRTYVISDTDPIPLTVTTLPSSLEKMGSPMTAPIPQIPEASTASEEEHGQLMEIAGCVALSSRGLKRDQTPWKALWVFPIAGLAWTMQWMVREICVRKRSANKQLASQERLKQASLHWKLDRGRALRELEAALLLALYERGHVQDLPTSMHMLSTDGAPGRVRRFLEIVHASHYGREGDREASEIDEEARRVWESL